MSCLIFFFLVGSALACEFHFRLISPEGEVEKIFPGEVKSLQKGETYTLCVDFVADHRRCTVPPEETVFLLQEEKWKTSKGYLALRLMEETEWVPLSSLSWTKELRFTALEQGTYGLEILRECPKGGYDEWLDFLITD